MKINKISSINVIAASLIAAFSFSSCVEENIVDREEALNSTTISYDLSGFAAQSNDQEYNVYTRKLYAGNYSLLYNVATKNAVVLSPSSLISEEPQTEFHFGLGEFKSVAVTHSHPAFQITKFRNAIYDPSYEKLSAANLQYNVYTRGSSKLERPADGFVDVNEYLLSDSVTKSGFVIHSTKPVLEGISDNVTLEPNGKAVVKFEPMMLTSDVNIQIQFAKQSVEGNKFVIDSVYCVLAGVAASKNALHHTLNTDDTHKIIFKAEMNSADNINNLESTITLNKHLHILGLVNKTDKSATTGPGYMQLIFYTRDADGKKKVVNALSNISAAIRNAKLLIKTENGYVTNWGSQSLNIVVGTPLRGGNVQTAKNKSKTPIKL